MMRGIKEGRIRDIMTSPAYTLRPETPISGLKTLFAIHETTGFAVVDEERRLRGVVTVFDLLRAFRSPRSRWTPDVRALWGERVEDIMSPGAWTLDADEPIASAVDMMLNRNVGVIPVVEGRRGDGRLVGIIEVRHVLSSLIFESPVSHGRHAHVERHARYDGRAEGRHASSHRWDDHAYSREPQAVE